MKDNITFFKEFLNEYKNTGSCFPTSRWAAEALTSPIRNTKKAKTILEIGPGTGSVTTKILSDMGDQDQLTICEINERFMNSLKAKLAKNRNFQKHKERITFFLGPMQNLPEDIHYDLIVSAMPFLNFELEMVKEIFEKLKKLGTDNTIITYYEYIGLRSIGKSVAPLPVKTRLRELDCFFKSIYSTHDAKKQRVWLNLLPVNIYTIRLAA